MLSSRIPSQALLGTKAYAAHLDDSSSSMSSLASAVEADTAVQVPDTSRYRRILPKGCVDVSHVTPAVALYPVNSVLPLLPEAYSHVTADSCSQWSQLEPASSSYQPAPATVAVGDDSTHEHVTLPQAPADHDSSLAVMISTATFQAPLNPHTDSKEVITSFVHAGHDDVTSGSHQIGDRHVHVTGV